MGFASLNPSYEDGVTPDRAALPAFRAGSCDRRRPADAVIAGRAIGRPEGRVALRAAEDAGRPAHLSADRPRPAGSPRCRATTRPAIRDPIAAAAAAIRR